MELQLDLGLRVTVSKAGNSSSRRWGVFKCPACNTDVERITQKGITSKSCGASTCRKATGAFNSWNTGFAEDAKIKNIAFYSTLSDYHRRVIKSKECCSEWDSFKMFISDMHTSYVALRATGVSKLTLYVLDSLPLSKHNCYWIEDKYVKETDFKDDEVKGIKHTLMLEQEIGIKHSVIVRTLNKMDKSFGLSEYKTVSRIGFMSRPTMAYTLSNYQYTRLKDRLIDNVKRTTSTHVYLIKGTSFIKIGTAHDVDMRFKALSGSNENKLTLLYSKNVIEGTRVEAQLHLKYAAFNHHHEWFNLDEQQIKEIIAYLDNIK